ncbi:hypothetical protein H1R17_13645 [Flavobacterium sp. xlx-214]|uniref:glycosyltransferase family 2 protein n=1 Tax=unclassified Flavobacterium TaxID=196869 RepID=UPI0013D255FE|nr:MULTISPECIES: hypothetical protein [unclassified Flavobacterium]MBA5791363.1 hypothetical protein [Flavobacterium sp. xlx-221]QMI83484.1 hypothetical protein H1R17_13645 [Flavobacterium sp. xlx-214]
MDIYIKSFNRAYLLHRTIASIYHFLDGFSDKIIVLDDGTPQRYLDKIQQLFPDVIIKKSPNFEKKSNHILLETVPEKVIPADFWRNEILKVSANFILLEDDMWFKEHINYTDFVSEVCNMKVDMIKFMWLKNEKLRSKNIVQSKKYFDIIEPKVLTTNGFLFTSIFKTNQLKVSSIVSKFKSKKDELLKYYHLYIVAGGVFSQKYYEKVWCNSANIVDELLQIREVLKHIKSFKFAHTKTEIIKATYKFTASTIDKEHFATSLDVFKLNKILNEAWVNGKEYDILDFENDISSKWIEECCTNTDVDFNDWKNWYEQFKASYESMGCVIE